MAAAKKKTKKTKTKAKPKTKKAKLKVSKKKVVAKKPKRKVVAKRRVKKLTALNLKRFGANPIIEPDEKYWESKATFNPSAIEHEGRVHVIYRAIGDTDISVFGYARSGDGYTFDPASRALAYYHKNKQVPDRLTTIKLNYESGGGWGGGCEDPRLTLLDDRVYVIYTAFDGWASLRLAMTSVSLEDFIHRRFDWKKPVLISPPHQINKNWVLFPEKINGPATNGASKYAILHSISPKVLVQYFDSLDELDGEHFIESVHQDSSEWQKRDGLTRGVGPAPVKTKLGWLVLYHKLEKHDSHRYKLWAMILDEHDPSKVLYNSTEPILEPDLWYENEGYKNGVIYACGAIVKNGQLFVYYGGADKVSCVATAPLDEFLSELVKHKVSKLKSKKIKM